jgi:hypothetical protein
VLLGRPAENDRVVIVSSQYINQCTVSFIKTNNVFDHSYLWNVKSLPTIASSQSLRFPACKKEQAVE